MTTTTARLALATCAELPELDPDDQTLGEALLDGPFRGQLADELYRQEIMTARDASDAERELGERVVAALPELAPGVDGSLLYARVDLIPDDEGNPVILEVELTEPSLFFAHAEGSAARFAEAIAARL